MTGNIQSIGMALSGLGEIAVLCGAGFILFRRWGNTFAEAAAYGIVASLMVLSFLFQLAFLMGAPILAMGAETLTVIAALIAILKFFPDVKRDWQIARTFFWGHMAAGIVLSSVWCFLVFRAVAYPPEGIAWESLWPVLGFQKYGSFFATGYYSPISGLIPVNTLILPHLFLRFNTGIGVGIFGFLGYLAIGFATYALSRRYSWPPTSITITMVVLSLPRMVYHATTAGQEIVPAAVGVFCLLALYRVVEQPNFRDLLMLVLGILFSIAGERLCLIFPCILILLTLIVLFRRHGARTWWQMLRRHRWVSLLAIPPVVVFSQSWLFLFNIINGRSWAGSGVSGFSMNMDGIQGSLANMFRYFLESAHFTLPVDLFCQKVMGFSLVGLINSVYASLINDVFGNLGAAAPFAVSWEPGTLAAWFGPLGFLLILPALFYALVRGPRRLKAVALAMTGYVYIITLIPAWIPGNARYFTIFYACCGFMGAFFLPPWRFSRKGKRRLQVISALLMAYSCTMGW